MVKGNWIWGTLLVTAAGTSWGWIAAGIRAADLPDRRTLPTVAEGELIAFSGTAADGQQQITLIDPKARVMSVYHIAPTTGEIALRSVRNFHWDLLLEEYNGGNPSPEEIRNLQQPR